MAVETSVPPTLSASGVTQAGAAPIVTTYANIVATPGNEAVLLPQAVAGTRIVLASDNLSGPDVLVFPELGESIFIGGRGYGPNVPAQIGPDAGLILECVKDGNWLAVSIG